MLKIFAVRLAFKRDYEASLICLENSCSRLSERGIPRRGGAQVHDVGQIFIF
jgi:hypothetical protein